MKNLFGHRLRLLSPLLLSSLAMTGCLGASGLYPQYTGLYTLEGARFESGAAQAAVVPSQIRVTHRLYFQGNAFQSWMKVEPEAESRQSVLSGFVLPLEELSHRGAPNIENPSVDGIPLRIGQKTKSPTATFCSLTYQWSVYSDRTSGFSPSIETVQKLYPSHSVVAVSDGALSLPLTSTERLNPPVEELARQQWDSALIEKKGAVLQFALTMQALGAVYGCSGEGEGLPAGQFGPEGRVILTYHASEEALDQMSNPVLQDLSEFTTGWDRGLKFWSQLVDVY